MVLPKWEINCNSYQWPQHKSFEEHAKPVFCVFHLIRISQKSLYPNHRGITQANFFEALALITFYDSSCISTPLSSSWNLLARWHPEHAAVTQLISLCKPRLASNFWPSGWQHVRTRRTTIVPQPAEHWRRQASLEAVCAPTELPARELVQPVSTSRLQAAAAAQPQSPLADSCASGFRWDQMRLPARQLEQWHRGELQRALSPASISRGQEVWGRRCQQLGNFLGHPLFWDRTQKLFIG